MVGKLSNRTTGQLILMSTKRNEILEYRVGITSDICLFCSHYLFENALVVLISVNIGKHFMNIGNTQT